MQDYIVADYVLEIRDELDAAGLQLARDSVAALQKLLPRRRFRTEWAVVQGWSAECPPEQAPPCPEELCWALVAMLMHLRQSGVALCLLLCFVGLLRVGEAVIFCGEAEIVLFIRQSKRSMHERVVLASPFVVAFVKRCLVEKAIGPQELVCRVTSARVRAWLDRVLQGLRFGHLALRSHSFRRGYGALHAPRAVADNHDHRAMARRVEVSTLSSSRRGRLRADSGGAALEPH